MTTRLEVTELLVHYGPVRALSPVSFQLDDAGLVLILGPNGAGKTSLVKAIAGAVASTGRVKLNGGDISHLKAHERVRRGVALVPEGRGPLPGLSVHDNLLLGWRGGSGTGALSQSEMERALELFPILKERLSQDCATLSGGQMQMLAIARAMLAKPQVMLLDEPSLGLAPASVSTAYSGLAALNQGGLPMILVEQKAVPLWREPDCTLVLKNGQVLRRFENARPNEQELMELYLGGVTQ